MGMRIQTNISSVNAQRMLRGTTLALNSHMEKLSSGYRINKAADDAAGLAISEKLRSDVRGLTQAKRNANDAISLVQTAEGGLNEISNIVIRLRELGVQAASDTLGNVERGYLQREFGELKNEIDRIAYSTEFNGTKLLVGRTELPDIIVKNSNPPPLEFQVAQNYIPDVDGLDQKNPVDIIRLDLQDFNALTYGEGSLEIGFGGDEDSIRVDSKQGAQKALSQLDNAIERVNYYRASLGATQNRLLSAVSNLGTQIENQEAAKSRIRDTDYAEEASNLAKQQVLQNAGVSVLAQANQQPQLALKLLSGV
jgi:flagellin